MSKTSLCNALEDFLKVSMLSVFFLVDKLHALNQLRPGNLDVIPVKHLPHMQARGHITNEVTDQLN